MIESWNPVRGESTRGLASALILEHLLRFSLAGKDARERVGTQARIGENSRYGIRGRAS